MHDPGDPEPLTERAAAWLTPTTDWASAQLLERGAEMIEEGTRSFDGVAYLQAGVIELVMRDTRAQRGLKRLDRLLDRLLVADVRVRYVERRSVETATGFAKRMSTERIAAAGRTERPTSVGDGLRWRCA